MDSITLEGFPNFSDSGILGSLSVQKPHATFSLCLTRFEFSHGKTLGREGWERAEKKEERGDLSAQQLAPDLGEERSRETQ